MSDDYPEPERTITVEEAHLLHDQIDHSESEAEDAEDEVNEAYQKRRAAETREMVKRLEGKGLRESEIREQYRNTAGMLDDLEADTVEWAKTLARHDTARQIINEYFGGTGNEPVELGDLVGDGELEDGTIKLEGMKRTVHLTCSTEGMARATANTFLQKAGTSLDELRSGVGQPL